MSEPAALATNPSDAPAGVADERVGGLQVSANQRVRFEQRELGQ
jgi:hypothetical protein